MKTKASVKKNVVNDSPHLLQKSIQYIFLNQNFVYREKSLMKSTFETVKA